MFFQTHLPQMLPPLYSLPQSSLVYKILNFGMFNRNYVCLNVGKKEKNYESLCDFTQHFEGPTIGQTPLRVQDTKMSKTWCFSWGIHNFERDRCHQLTCWRSNYSCQGMMALEKNFIEDMAFVIVMIFSIQEPWSYRHIGDYTCLAIFFQSYIRCIPRK